MFPRALIESLLIGGCAEMSSGSSLQPNSWINQMLASNKNTQTRNGVKMRYLGPGQASIPVSEAYPGPNLPIVSLRPCFYWRRISKQPKGTEV